ncbi:MAG: ATP-binding protein [Gemmataceae bacterium]
MLDETRCVGCGWCVLSCPTGCLEQAGPMPWLPRPADCIHCGLCVLLCPVDALTLTVPLVETF